MDMGARLDSRHHTFLQALLNRGPLSEKSATELFQDLMKDNSGEGLVGFLCDINRELEFVQMEVKKITNQYDGQQIYGIINTLPSKEAKIGTQYSSAQILFFTALVESIALDPSASGFIRSSAALYLRLTQGESQSQVDGARALSGVALIKLSMQAKQEALDLLEADQYLTRSDDGMVGLGVKSLLELRSFFRNLGVPFCAVCNEAAIKAQVCSTEGCCSRIHSYCLSRKSRSRKQTPRCPSCGAEWDMSAIGKDVYAEENGGGNSRQKSVQISGKRKSRQIASLADDDADEPAEENGLPEDVTPRSVSVEGRGKRRRVIVAADEGGGPDNRAPPSKSARLQSKRSVAAAQADDGSETDEDPAPPSKSARLQSKRNVAAAHTNGGSETDEDPAPPSKSTRLQSMRSTAERTRRKQ